MDIVGSVRILISIRVSIVVRMDNIMIQRSSSVRN